MDEAYNTSALKEAMEDNKARVKKRIDGCDMMIEKMATCHLSLLDNMWEKLVLFLEPEEGMFFQDISCVLSLSF